MFPFLHSFPHCSMASFGFHESQHIVALHRKGRTGRDTLDHLGRGHKPGRILLLECFLNLCLQKQQQPGCWALQCSCSECLHQPRQSHSGFPHQQVAASALAVGAAISFSCTNQLGHPTQGLQRPNPSRNWLVIPSLDVVSLQFLLGKAREEA